MNPMMKARVLTVVMLLLGILLIAGSTVSIFATSLFPFDGLAGTDASVAGVAFGIGIAVAAFNPVAHVSWVRIAILYCILVIVYRVVFGMFWGTFGTGVPMVMAIIFGIALIVLYPTRGDLMPHSGTVAEDLPDARIGAH